MALFDNVGVDAVDAGGGIGGNVAVAIVLSGFVDLEIAEIGQVGGSESFGSLFIFSDTHVSVWYLLSVCLVGCLLCLRGGGTCIRPEWSLRWIEPILWARGHRGPGGTA